MTAVVTLEVRWFFPGVVPVAVQTWFDSIPAPSLHEVRQDIYDLEAARQRVGLKRRYPARTLDCKMMMSAQEGADLGFGIVGDLENWVKITQPLLDDPDGLGEVAISKKTQAKRRYLDTGTGCEAEMAEIRMGSIAAWTLCLETFGDALLRTDAMEHGLEAVFGVSGSPRGVELGPSTSSSYPQWISAMHYGSEDAVEGGFFGPGTQIGVQRDSQVS